jgi:hypothetical protein
MSGFNSTTAHTPHGCLAEEYVSEMGDIMRVFLGRTITDSSQERMVRMQDVAESFLMASASADAGSAAKPSTLEERNQKTPEDDGVFMARVRKLLADGGSVRDADLEQFHARAVALNGELRMIPEYRLVARDLIHEANRVYGYLVARGLR